MEKMGDFNARSGELTPRDVVEEEDNNWYRDDSFSGSDRRSEDKVLNDEGRKLISFCEILNLEILNGDIEGDIPGKMTFVAKTGASVIDYILCTYGVGRCVKTFRVREMGISDHNMIEAVTEVKYINENAITERKIEHRGNKLQLYKWYEGKRNNFEQRRDAEIMVLFLQGIEYFLSMQETENAIRVLNFMMNNLGDQMRRRGKENSSWKDWNLDECKKGKEKVMKAINRWNKEKTRENRYKIVEAKNYTRK
jgi:hypothetical protein